MLTAALDMKATISGKQHSLLYFLAAAMQPRMLLTIDEQGTAHVCLSALLCSCWHTVPREVNTGVHVA